MSSYFTKINWGRRFHDAGGEDFFAQLQTIKEQGFGSVQLAPGKSLGFSRTILTPGYAAGLARCLADADIRVAMLGSYFDLSARGEEREAVLQRYYDHLLLAAWAGFPVIGTETGHIKADAPDYDEAYQAVEENLGLILEKAEKLGVCVAVEPVYGHTIHGADKMEKLLQRYPTENLRVIYDPVNLLDPALEDSRESMWQDFLDRLGDRLAVVHVKDYEIVDGKKKDLPAATGRMDYSHLMRLAEQKPGLDFLIETAKDEFIPGIKDFFKI